MYPSSVIYKLHLRKQEPELNLRLKRHLDVVDGGGGVEVRVLDIVNVGREALALISLSLVLSLLGAAGVVAGVVVAGAVVDVVGERMKVFV